MTDQLIAYLVWRGEYTAASVEAVFLDKRAAEELLARYNGPDGARVTYGCDARIEEMEVGKVPEFRTGPAFVASTYNETEFCVWRPDVRLGGTQLAGRYGGYAFRGLLGAVNMVGVGPTEMRARRALREVVRAVKAAAIVVDMATGEPLYVPESR